jgi:hypothetical protein
MTKKRMIGERCRERRGNVVSARALTATLGRDERSFSKAEDRVDRLDTSRD